MHKYTHTHTHTHTHTERERERGGYLNKTRSLRHAYTHVVFFDSLPIFRMSRARVRGLPVRPASSAAAPSRRRHLTFPSSYNLQSCDQSRRITRASLSSRLFTSLKDARIAVIIAYFFLSGVVLFFALSHTLRLRLIRGCEWSSSRLSVSLLAEQAVSCSFIKSVIVLKCIFAWLLNCGSVIILSIMQYIIYNAVDYFFLFWYRYPIGYRYQYYLIIDIICKGFWILSFLLLEGHFLSFFLTLAYWDDRYTSSPSSNKSSKANSRCSDFDWNHIVTFSLSFESIRNCRTNI